MPYTCQHYITADSFPLITLKDGKKIATYFPPLHGSPDALGMMAAGLSAPS